MYQYAFLFYMINVALTFNAPDYLFRYGYLDQPNETAIADLEVAIAAFQEFYNITPDGTLNYETVQLMERSRCGLTDNPSMNYEVSPYKWLKTDITWYFALGNKTTVQIASKLFDIWKNYTNLNITYSVKDPGIIISFSSNPVPKGTADVWEMLIVRELLMAGVKF